MHVDSMNCGSSMAAKKDEVDVLKLKKQLDAANINFILLEGKVEAPLVARKVVIAGGIINSTVVASVVNIASDSDVMIGENAKIFCGTFFTDCPSLSLSQAVKAGKIFIRPGRNCVNYLEREGNSNFLILREGKNSFSSDKT